MKKQILNSSKVVLLTMGIFLIPLSISAQGSKLSASNISRYIGNGRWDWTIFIKASPEILENIDCVEYKLHPSFPKPVRSVCSLGDPRYPFGLKCNGWGTFEISIKVTFKNRKTYLLKHMLTFEAPLVKDLLPIQADNEATYLSKGRWHWTVFIRGPADILDQIQLVEYTLHHTFPDPVQEVFERGEGHRGFALSAIGWGVFKIRIRVFLKNGWVQNLEHGLKF